MRRLIAPVLICLMAASVVGKDRKPKANNNEQLVDVIQELRREIRELRDEIQDLRSRPPYLLPPVPPISQLPPADVRGGAQPTAAASAAGQAKNSPNKKPAASVPSPDQHSDPGSGAIDRARNWTVLNLDVGGNRQLGTPFTASAHARYFRPFGSNAAYSAFQLEGEYLYFKDRQEAQFDAGLVNRIHRVELGAFSSFKHVRISNLDRGGTLGQAAFLADYIFPRARLGAFVTRAFLNDVTLVSSSTAEIFLRAADQFGANGSLALPIWHSQLDGTFAGLHRDGGGLARYNTFAATADFTVRPDSSSVRSGPVGGNLRWTIPFPGKRLPIAFTFEGAYNETLLAAGNSWRATAGLQFGSWPEVQQTGGELSAAPMQVPRLRYEVLMRSPDAGAPIANAGPDQIGVPPGQVSLNGSASLNATHFHWREVTQNGAQIDNPNARQTSFQARPSTVYVLELEVSNDRGQQSTARSTVSTRSSASPNITRFVANPAAIIAGEKAGLAWEVTDADSVTIQATDSKGTTTNVGTFSPVDVTFVTPTSTTVYTLTAKNNGGATSTGRVTVTVGIAKPTIDYFYADPAVVPAGGTAHLCWSTQNAQTVLLDGRNVVLKTCQDVVVNQRTSFQLVASNGNAADDTRANLTVEISAPSLPVIESFTVSNRTIVTGDQTFLSWNVRKATSVTISELGSVSLTGEHVVKPAVTTTYILTATGAAGPVTMPLTVVVRPAPKIESLTVSPDLVRLPTDVPSLCWSTSNADEITITSIGRVSSGGCISLHPTTTTTYVLVASSEGGSRSDTKSVVVSVNFRTPFEP